MTGESRQVGQYVSKREAQAAARARVTADRRLKRDTPDWIVDLAASKRPGPGDSRKSGVRRSEQTGKWSGKR